MQPDTSIPAQDPRSADPAVLVLPPRPTAADRAALMDFLSAHMDRPVRLVARDKRCVDGLELQILLTAQRHWAARSLGFAVTEIPPLVAGMLRHLGVEPHMLGEEA
jgi:hypothetical protein